MDLSIIAPNSPADLAPRLQRLPASVPPYTESRAELCTTNISWENRERFLNPPVEVEAVSLSDSLHKVAYRALPLIARVGARRGQVGGQTKAKWEPQDVCSRLGIQVAALLPKRNAPAA